MRYFIATYIGCALYVPCFTACAYTPGSSDIIQLGDFANLEGEDTSNPLHYDAGEGC